MLHIIDRKRPDAPLADAELNQKFAGMTITHLTVSRIFSGPDRGRLDLTILVAKESTLGRITCMAVDMISHGLDETPPGPTPPSPAPAMTERLTKEQFDAYVAAMERGDLTENCLQRSLASELRLLQRDLRDAHRENKYLLARNVRLVDAANALRKQDTSLDATLKQKLFAIVDEVPAPKIGP